MSSLRSAVVGIGCAVALTACSLLPGSGGDDTGGSSDRSTSAASSGDASSAPGDDVGTVTGPGRPMDEGGLRAALPSAGDVGDGWVDDEQMTISEAEAGDVTPTSCAPLLQKGPGWDEVKRTERARVQVNFARADNPPPPGSERHHLGTWVYSFDDPYPSRLFDEAGALVAECPTFDFRQTDTGNTSTYEVEALTFPALGDRTVAFRLQIQQTLETITMDFVVIKVGHNTVSVANGTYNGTPDTAVTERVARSVLSGLEQ